MQVRYALSSRALLTTAQRCRSHPSSNPLWNQIDAQCVGVRSLVLNMQGHYSHPRSTKTLSCLPPREHPRSSLKAKVLRQSSNVTKHAKVHSHPASYQPPTTGVISKLPVSWIPYAELVRIDKPTGTYYLFFPCLFSTLMAAPLMTPITSPPEVITTTLLFFTGALVMRGAGCTINDLWDRNLDPHVERTRLRPIARRAVSPQNAIVFLGLQLLTGLGILLQFPTQCLLFGIPSLLLVATYPLAKRVTNYPQAILGLTFSWGAIMGYPALHVDLLSNPAALASAAVLYASCVAWTVIYDMIYAHMDIKDDLRAGIKSIALAHEHNTKAVLSGLSVVQIGLLATAGYLTGAGPVFFAGSCFGGGLTLTAMIRRVRLGNPENCWWWFKNGCLLTGGTITSGMLLDYTLRFSAQFEKGNETLDQS